MVLARHVLWVDISWCSNYGYNGFSHMTEVIVANKSTRQSVPHFNGLSLLILRREAECPLHQISHFRLVHFRHADCRDLTLAPADVQGAGAR